MRITVTPMCPKCGSGKTGFFIPYCGNFAEEQTKHFKRGERVRMTTDIRGSYNLFCDNCGLEWKGTLKTQNMSSDEFKEYLETHEFYTQRDHLKGEIEKQEEEKPKKKHDLWKGFVWLATGNEIGRKERRKKKDEQDNDDEQDPRE